MSAAKNTDKRSASMEVSFLSGDIQMGCLNIDVLLDSIIDSLDGLNTDPDEPGTHRRFDQINCYASCAKQIVTEVLENSLAMAKAAREVQK